MKKRALQWRVFKDDGGQALTEFAIVIPIVLLMFFALLQYFADVRASQLGNYAAYMSARVYAVNNSVDPENSQTKAQKAAAMALSPIAGLAPGEFPIQAVGNAPGMDMLNAFMGNSAGKIVVGYLVAQYGRFGLLGGSVANTVEGTPQQVDTMINYPQPVYVPGLAEMWNFIVGNRIYYSMKPLRQGLGGLPGAFLPIWEYYDQMQQFQSQLAPFDININLPPAPTFILPYINIQSKCSIGYANWQMYNGGPRLHAKSTDTDSSKPDPEAENLEQNAEQSSQDANDYNSAMKTMNDACAKLNAAQSDVTIAQRKLDEAEAESASNPNRQRDISAAQSQLASAQAAEQAAQNSYNNAKSEASTAQQALASDGVSVPTLSTSCN